MKYTDRNTIKHAIKHEAKMAYDDSTSWSRLFKRQMKAKTKKFLQRVSKENIYWWKSLDDRERHQIVQYHSTSSITEIIKVYPGNKAIVRELKLKELKV